MCTKQVMTLLLTKSLTIIFKFPVSKLQLVCQGEAIGPRFLCRLSMVCLLLFVIIGVYTYVDNILMVHHQVWLAQSVLSVAVGRHGRFIWRTHVLTCAPGGPHPLV